jgi:cation transport ATPase
MDCGSDAHGRQRNHRRAVAKLGVDDVRRECCRQTRRVIIELATGSGAVAGDGINDAPALASGGWCCLTPSADVAIESADITLEKDLNAIVRARRLSRAT